MPKKRPAVAAVLVIMIVVIFAAAVWAGSVLSNQANSSTQGSAPVTATYNDNGLTCSLSANAAPYVATLVPKVTQDSRFLSVANGSAYVFEYTDNITGRSVVMGGTLQSGATQNGRVVDGTTIQLPDVVEMVFYTFGPDTSCGETSSAIAIHSIVVQVPIEAGGFDLTAATFHLSGVRE